MPPPQQPTGEQRERPDQQGIRADQCGELLRQRAGRDHHRAETVGEVGQQQDAHRSGERAVRAGEVGGAGHRRGEHGHQREPWPRRGPGHPVEGAGRGQPLVAVLKNHGPGADLVWRTGVGRDRGRQRLQHPVHAVVVPAPQRFVRHLPPHRRPLAVGAGWHRGGGEPVGIEVGRWRIVVEVDPTRADSRVRFPAVAGDGHLGPGLIANFEPAAVLDHAQGEAGNRRREGREGGLEVGRTDAADLVCQRGCGWAEREEQPEYGDHYPRPPPASAHRHACPRPFSRA